MDVLGSHVKPDQASIPEVWKESQPHLSQHGPKAGKA